MKAWREVALADPEDCDREWEAYLALVSGKETASVSPSTDTTSTLHSRVHGPAVVSASSATRSTASLHAPSSAISTTTPAAAASTSTSTRESSPATKDDLSPESRLIYDYIVGNSDEFASRDGLSPGARRYYDYLISGSAPPASATTDASTNLDNTDLTAPTPTICSSECPSKDAPTSVPVITPSTTPDSSTTICAVVPELSAPADSAKALDMDVMGDTAPTATICLPGGPDHSTGGEDPMDMSLPKPTRWMSMPWQSVRFHWVATYPILLWKLLTSHPHEDPSGFAKSFVLYWTSPLDENKMHLLHVAETLWSKLLSMGNMEDCLQYEHQQWRLPDPVISLACMGELFLRSKDCRSDIWVHILDAISARLSTSTIMPAGKLCLLLGQLCLLGFLVVQPFSTKAQAVTLCPNEVSLGNFAISSVDYMMMNRYTPCYAWMMLNDSFLPAGISSYFKFAAGNTIIFLPWDPGLPLSSIDTMFSTVVDGLAARLRRSSEVICLQRNSIYELFSCKKGMVALEEQPWTSWECVIFLQPKPPWSYVGPTISFGVAESLHIIGVCLEFTQFVLAPSQGSGTYGCLNFERNLMGQNFICLLGLYSSYDQYIAQDATYFGFQPTATCALLKIQPVGGYCKFYAAFLFSRDSTSTRVLAIKYISRMICLPRQHSEMGNNLAVAMLLLSSQISKGWVLYLPVTCIMQCRSELLPWVLANSRDGILTYIKRVLISWDPGGSVLVLHAATGDNWNSSQQPFLHLTWDPGGYMQHRLEGKPNLKEGGLSTTHSIRGLGRTMDFHLVGLGLLRSHGRSATKEKQRTTINGAWNEMERRLRPRLGWRV